MVGDEAACRLALVALQERVEQLLLAELSLEAAPSGSASPWAALVPRFRALRESLTSEGVAGELALRAYEAAADVCLRAGDLAEFLKCQQRLVSELYPDAVARGLPAERWPELAACAALYFACAGGGTPGEMTAALRATPRHLLRTAPVQCALRALCALARADGAAFCAAAQHPHAPPLLRLLMARRLPAARHAALRAAARAYRTLPLCAVAKALHLPTEAVAAVLQEAAAAPGAPQQLAAAAARDHTNELVFVA